MSVVSNKTKSIALKPKQKVHVLRNFIVYQRNGYNTPCTLVGKYDKMDLNFEIPVKEHPILNSVLDN